MAQFRNVIVANWKGSAVSVRDTSQTLWARDSVTIGDIVFADNVANWASPADVDSTKASNAVQAANTAAIAERFPFTVGVDLAAAALRQARTLDAPGGWGFAVTAAPDMPVRSGSCAFVFDRGCYHLLEREDRTRYFGEVERLLVPGGTALVIEHTHTFDDVAVPAALEEQERSSFVYDLGDRQTEMTALVLRRSHRSHTRKRKCPQCPTRFRQRQDDEITLPEQNQHGAGRVAKLG